MSLDAKMADDNVNKLLKALASNETIGSADLKTIFEDEARYEPAVPLSKPAIGRRDIQSAIARWRLFSDKRKSRISASVIGKRHILIERLDIETLSGSGREISVPRSSVFNIGSTGRIASWREYFDTLGVARQAGINMHQWEEIVPHQELGFRVQREPTEVASNENEMRLMEMLDALQNVQSPTMEQLTQFFTEDAVYHPAVFGVDAVLGATSICEFLTQEYKLYRPLSYTIHALGSNSTHVFTERTDIIELVSDGRKIASHLLTIFEVGPDGRIQKCRPYYDPLAMMRQMGL